MAEQFPDCTMTKVEYTTRGVPILLIILVRFMKVHYLLILDYLILSKILMATLLLTQSVVIHLIGGGRGIQGTVPGKQLCNGVVALYTLSKNTNGCDREMVIQVGFKSGYWTFSTKSSNDTLSKIICINHR